MERETYRNRQRQNETEVQRQIQRGSDIETEDRNIETGRQVGTKAGRQIQRQREIWTTAEKKFIGQTDKERESAKETGKRKSEMLKHTDTNMQKDTEYQASACLEIDRPYNTRKMSISRTVLEPTKAK